MILGSLFLIGGTFIAVAGLLGGFGASGIGSKIIFFVIGLAVFGLGLYFYYQGSNKSLLKIIGDIIDAVISSI